MSRVDIHADDYGYSLNTSRDIIECMKQGKLDSISIICNTSYFEESMEILYETIPDLPFLPLMSIHLNFPEGKSENDMLPMSWGKLFLSSYGFNRSKVKAVLKENLVQQISKTQKAIEKCIEIAETNGIEHHQKGIRLDSHVHTHLIPVVWQSLMEVIEEEKYEIEYIRNPKEPLGPFVKNASLWPSYNVINLIKNRILMFYSGKADRFCDTNKTDKMYLCGLMMSGHMDLDRVQMLYPELLKKAQKDGRDLEFLFHPGMALELEYREKEMDPQNFRNFNSSKNRHIEMNAVMNFNRIIK